jgi:hypothetical protein
MCLAALLLQEITFRPLIPTSPVAISLDDIRPDFVAF